uniref:Cyclic nucleotide-binding domain-containing protein n=3 Tax=Clytia hemisphaerica TaxID=252671 RepID=A0A7M5URE0_9CNID
EVIYEDTEMQSAKSTTSIPNRTTQKNSIQYSTQPNISPILENGFCRDGNSLNPQEKMLTRRATTKTITMNMATGDEDAQGREFRSESHRRWSVATQKIKSILAVNDALNGSKTRARDRERSMSIEQKSHFLDKFSTTRDRRFSGASFDLRRRPDGNHLTDGASNISSVELKELLNDIKDSKTNVSNCIDDFHEQRRCRFLHILFEPYSTFIYIWSWIVILAIHYNTWVIILRIAFPAAQRNYTGLWFSLDYTADLIYIIDVLVSSRMSFLENGIYVESVKRVTVKYFKSTLFILDLVSLLPLDLLYLFFQTNPAFRIPRLIKFFKVFQGKKLVESMTNFPNLVRGVFWLHIMFLLMHWNCCFFYIISEMEGFGSNKWVYPKLEGLHHILIHRYIKCMYWSTLVLTTIGEDSTPETTVECAYMIVCYITGIFIFATIVGQAGNVIQNMNASRMEFERQRDNTMQYMKEHNVPTHLQKRVRLWYDYTYSRGRFNGGDDINEITMLPDKMKTELALHVHLETLRKVSFLQKCQPEFLHDLVLKMKLHIFTPGDFIIRKGEIAREMYVISDGMAEVVSESGRVLKVLQAGDFFGEIGLLSLSAGQNRRTADVRSCGYIELFVLSKEDVMSSIRDYPEAQRILAKHGRKRLALGSIVAAGPRDETTSGSSQSDSEIELKITRPDSDEGSCRSLFENGDIENNNTSTVRKNSHTKIDIKDDNVFTDRKDDVTETGSVNKYLTSPRNSIFLDTPNHKSRSMVHLKQRASVVTHGHGNVVGPATSIKSLDKRTLENSLSQSFSRRSSPHRSASRISQVSKTPSPTTNFTSDSEEENSDHENHRDESLAKRWLKPRTKKHMQRSNSDMQRRPKRTSNRSKRCVFSDGESKNYHHWSEIMKRGSSVSTCSYHSAGAANHTTTTTTKHQRHSVATTPTAKHRDTTTDEDLFLRSMKKLYLETTKHFKKRTHTQVKRLKRKMSDMEQSYLESYLAKEKEWSNRDEQLRKELFRLEEQMYDMKGKMKEKDEEINKLLGASDTSNTNSLVKSNHLEAMVVEEKNRIFTRNHHRAINI